MHQPLDNLVVKFSASAIAASSATNSSPSAPIDMAGYDSVIFVTSITDSVATGVATLTIEGGDTADALTAIDGDVATVTSVADDDLNGKTLQVGIYRPTHRYLLPVRTSKAANIAFGDLTVILVPRLCPPDADASVAALTKVN